MDNIVITGTGIISSLGAGKEETLEKLRTGQRGIGPIRHIQTKHRDLPSGEVEYSDEQLKELIRYQEESIITRTSLLGRVALKEALEEARLDGSEGLRIAFISGNTVGGMEKSEQFYYDFLHNNSRNEYIAMHDCGACTDIMAKQFGGHFDLITTISTACSSAANAIILGANLIKEGRVDIAVVGGTECLSKFHINGFNTLMILDKEPCRPFDADRHGLNLGEGAAYLVMETETTARKRNIRPICKLAGYGNTCDAYHQTATSPNGEGAYLAMCQALKSSRLRPEDIDYINAHGTGTGNNDECEGIAMMRVFGDQMPPVSSTKSYTGHTTSAAGSVESVISILALTHGFIPANLGYQNPIEGHNFKPVDHVIENVTLKHVLTNSFGFGGNDSSCIFSALDTETPAPMQASEAGQCYIQSAAHVSIQQPIGDDWFHNPVMPAQAYSESLEPDYSKYFAPMAARRMGRLLKRALATAVEALGNHPVPDAIITGTGLGCIANTEKFLTAMIDNEEEFLQPTFFMQSTHNTIGSQVAQHLKCHGYNCTYSHRGTSFDSSLLDACLQMRAGAIGSALVGGHDEMTPAYFEMLGKIGYWKAGDVSPDALRRADSPGSLSGSCSLSMLLTAHRDADTLCRIAGMDMLYQPSDEELRAAADRILHQAGLTVKDLDAVVSGLSGDQDNDAVYQNFLRQYCPETPVVWYKHLFGESFCASAFGVYAGAVCLHKKLIPSHLLYNTSEEISNPKHILVHNHFQNKDHSLILLTL